MRPMTAIVLSGGVGKRFSPFVTNKPIWPFMGKPVIQTTLESLKLAQINHTIVITNSHNRKSIESISIPDMKITCVDQPEPLGMADALLQAESHIASIPILVLNATDIVDDSLYHTLGKQLKLNKPFITAIKPDTYFPGGYLKYKGDKLVAIIEKPDPDQTPSDWVRLVCDFFPNTTEFLELVHQSSSDSDDLYEVALSKYIQQHSVETLKYYDYWQPLKFPWHILDLTDYYLNNQLAPENNATFVAPSAVIDDNVVLSEGVKVYDYAVIKGPSYIGPNSIIGNHTLVRDSIIESNCQIGFGSEVARSYLGSHTQLHHNYVGDSVLESHVLMGYGATTANYRLDTKNIRAYSKSELIDTKKQKLGSIIAFGAKIGVNTSLMPGTTIGTKAIIGPSLTVRGNIAHDTTLAGEIITSS